MFFKASSALLFGLSALASLVSGQSNTKIGWSGVLSSLDGGLGGTVTVVDATTLMVTGYTLKDASAPALYWWGTTDNTIKNGFRISNAQVKSAATSPTLTIKLDAGKTTADFTTVGLWCESFSANFGQTTLMAPSGGSGSGGSSTSSMGGSTPSGTSSPMNGTSGAPSPSSSQSVMPKSDSSMLAASIAAGVATFLTATVFAAWMV